ncbi:MAG: hypothetical protein HOE53_03055 [Candidatus Magasanikbacteria bacterium]|jgi:hypothetical protein|nr:hypothetical protein [Candidatus Magasanikbacteria bacterium]
MNKKLSLIIGICGGVLLGLLVWQIYNFSESLPQQRATLTEQQTPPIGQTVYSVQDVRSASPDPYQLGYRSIPGPEEQLQNFKKEDCKRLTNWRERAKRVATQVTGITEHELFGVLTYPPHPQLDNRTRVGQFRVNTLMADILLGIEDEDEQLRVFAEMVSHSYIEDGLTKEVAYLAETLEPAVFKKMLAGKTASKVTLEDLTFVTIDGQNYWPDDVHQSIRDSADRALSELAVACAD